MAKSGKRPSLAGLGDRLAKKPAAAAASAGSASTAETTAGEQRRDAAGRRNRQPDGRKGILVRARPEAWKALKQVALDDERTLQDLMLEAINDVLQKHGKPPLA